MRKLITLVPAAALLLLAVSGAAAGERLKVNPDDLYVNPPNKDQAVIIEGKPRCIMGAHPIEITVYNRIGENSSKGTVQENGSFSVNIQGYSKDKILITFSAANGKRKKVKLTVPPQSIFPW